MPLEDASPEPSPEPFFGPRRLLRAILRAAALGLIAFPFMYPRVLATCAWAAIPVSLVEFWAVARDRSSLRLAALMFSFVSLVLVAAYFQAFYTSAAIAAGSPSIGVVAVESELASILGTFDMVVLVYLIECQALACTIAMLWRMRRRSARVVAWTWIGLSTLVPLADWVILPPGPLAQDAGTRDRRVLDRHARLRLPRGNRGTPRPLRRRRPRRASAPREAL